MVARSLGLRPGQLAAAPLLQAARAVAFEMDVPLEELPARATLSEPVRLALIAHLDATPKPFLTPEASFAAIVEHVCERLHDHHRMQRILVLGCGAGEDAYSTVLSLVEKGVDPNWFEVDAVDPRECALRRARTGWYGQRQLRDVPTATVGRHFVARDRGAQVASGLRGRLRFHEASLVDPQLLADTEPHDVVVCRDWLVASELTNRRGLIAQIARRLAPGGLLVLGEDDEDPSSRAGLLPFGGRSARAFRRQVAAPRPAERAALVESTRRIDAGGSEVRQLVVQGLLRLRRGDHPGADELFRKAISLDPECRGAIESLAREAGRPRDS